MTFTFGALALVEATGLVAAADADQRGGPLPAVIGQDRVVPWSQVEPLRVDHGKAIVKRFGQRHPLARTHLGSIPNLPMLLTLYEDLRRARRTWPEAVSQPRHSGRPAGGDPAG